MLIRRAELEPGRLVDLRLRGGSIEAVGASLAPEPDEEVLDAAGAAVLPGLHDHHLHLRAAAAAAESVDLRDVADEAGFVEALREADARLAPDVWLRVVGYHESMAGALDRATLDRAVPSGRPVRVQHRSGALWVLGSTALDRAGLDPDEPGVDVEAGHLWRRDDLVRALSSLDADALARFATRAAAAGITGFTDATPNGGPGDAETLAAELRRAGVVQRLHLMGPAGARRPTVDRADLGPVKVLLDDVALPALDDLVATMRAAHAAARPVAVHCVTRLQLALTVAALDQGGAQPGDRVEHGSVIPAELLDVLGGLGVTVVTQPHFVAERGDAYRRDVDTEDRPHLYRLASLRQVGIPVAAGTDAPFGAADPWASIAAAVDRRTRSGRVLGADEALDPVTAVGLYLGAPDDPGRPRRVAVGEPADLCVLTVPWSGLGDAIARAATEPPVRWTAIAGVLVHPHP